ncbi:hypothetical protein [Myceligenerans salitolerans]|nr:hypothetical protein [Myceligenerans salitolerans]
MSKSTKCPSCGQRVGVVNGAIAMHQKKGSGSATCPGSGKPT